MPRNGFRLHHVLSLQHVDPMNHTSFVPLCLTEDVLGVVAEDAKSRQKSFSFPVHGGLNNSKIGHVIFSKPAR